MNYKALILFIAFALVAVTAHSHEPHHTCCNTKQISARASQLKEVHKPSVRANTNHATYLQNSTNELEATAAILYLVYKNHISSQDMGSCVFHPSCSTFAIESLQKNNPAIAYMKVFDRLTRCHSLSKPGQYPQYKNTGLLYDPAN